MHRRSEDLHAPSAREVIKQALLCQWRGDLPFPPPQGLPGDLIPFAVQKGSLGPVMAALSRWGLLGCLDPNVRTRAETSLKYTEMVNLGMQRELERIIPLLREDFLDVVLFKGHDMIHSYYRDLRVRATTDADILIREGDLPRIARALKREGYTPNQGNPRSRWEKGTFRVDLHFHILDEDRISARKYLPRIPVEEIFAHARIRNIGGARYLSPDPYHSLIITAVHALKHAYVMDYWFMDAGMVISSMGNSFALTHLLRTADQYGLEKAVHIMLWALGALFHFPLFQFPLDDTALGGFSPGPLVRKCVTAATLHTRFLQFGTFLMGTCIGSLRKRLQYFLELAGPKATVLRKERGWGTPFGKKLPGLGPHGERFIEFFQSLATILKG